jgi:hypothetical protein
MKRAGNLLRAKMLYYLPSKQRHGVLPYVSEEGHPGLSGAKGPLGHSTELREGEKAWKLEGFRLAHVAVGQSHINLRTGSACCTPRRDVLDSARSLSGLEKLPFHFQEKPSYRQKEKAAREFWFWLLHCRGVLPEGGIHRSAGPSWSLPTQTVSG